ncbi:MAG: ester cyclase [Actinomycetota bacterium]|jgi:steroid delta-isomerase-like uncharacterized protein|nr:ester cyclase [Actinomycetota bacterium]
MNTSDENKDISRRADEELFNRGNLSIADELFASNFVYHDPVSHEEWRGPESVKSYATMLRVAFPDLHQTIEEQIAEGDKVAYRWTARGTHQGEFMGIAPTGNRVEMTGISIARLIDGKIEEIWENYDALGMMQQLGIVPSSEQAGTESFVA